MSTIILSDSRNIEESLICDFERAHGITIPTEYRSFLQKYNGGYPKPNYFKLSHESDTCIEGSVITRFLGLNNPKHCNLHDYFVNHKSLIPKGFLPIARDPHINLVLIGLYPENQGVYFWEREYSVIEGEEPSMNNMHFIHNSFNSFLNNLIP